MSQAMILRALHTKSANHGLSVHFSRTFSASHPSALRQMPPRPKPPPESDIHEVFLKGSGPGGQKIVCATFPPTVPSETNTLCYDRGRNGRN